MAETKSNKRLLILTSSWPRWQSDSTTSFVKEFAEHLSPNFDSIEVLAPHAAGAKEQESYGTNIHLTRYRYALPASAQTIAYDGGAVGKVKKTPVYALKLLSLIASLFFHTLVISLTKKIDTINAHWLIPQGFVAVLVGKITGKKVVITIHGGDVFNFNGKYMRKLKAFALKHADEVVVNSSATKEACESLYQRDYPIIPMGIDLKTFSPGKKSSKLVKRHNLNDFTIIHVGRLSKEKGTIYLLGALQQLREQTNVFKALIIGAGPEEKHLKAFVAEHNLQNHVEFVGWVDKSKLVDYYRTADVMVGPSLSEALGLVFVEAGATGLPVIASNAGGIRDVVEENKNGFLVPVADTLSIYQKLIQVNKDSYLREALSENAKLRASSRYSWTTIAEEYSNLL